VYVLSTRGAGAPAAPDTGAATPAATPADSHAEHA
jgi:hypothetical protein